MLVIKVWCLPRLTEKQLNGLHRNIVAAVASVEELDLKNETEMVCLFPSDMMSYGLGEEIFIEVIGFFKRPVRGNEGVFRNLAESLGKAVGMLFPNSVVDCIVRQVDPREGYWSNRT